MSEVCKDYAIKLFGKTIDVLPYRLVTEQKQSPSVISSSEEYSKDLSEYESTTPTEETLTETTTTTTASSETSASQEKTPLKKPDKIIPCPRCESLDTKFCYYNNYNVNQPRYFCRSCQRYWTSGGTMRNVPIGSGRRKTKNRDDVINSNQFSSFKYPNGFLIFGQDESMNPTLNLVQRSEDCGLPDNFYPTMPHWGSVPLFSAGTALGKRSREEAIDQNQRRRVLVPKTLRIDDPNEAAKSSIWSTLGIENGSVSGMSLFKAFEPKAHGFRPIDSSTMLLRANPAALSRSLNFNEGA